MTKDEEIALRRQRLSPQDPDSRGNQVEELSARITRLEAAKASRELALDGQIEKLKQVRSKLIAERNKVVKAPKEGDE